MYTMRVLVLLSVSSLSLANGVPALPTLPPTPAPDTRAPPTPAPPVACSESSSPLDASFSRGTEKLFRKCWSFQCVGTVRMTFLNYVARVDAVVYLLNSNGYQLMSLAGTHTNYTASYPANGEMSILYYDTNTWDPVNAIRIMAVWECEGGPVVRPAEDFDPSEYLTLPQEGTYQRLFSRMGPFNWVIPCTGTLNIVSQLGSVMHSTVRYNNSQNPVFSEGEPFTASRKYTVDDYFVVDLSGPWDIDMDNFFFLSWGCNNSVPALPTLPPTPVPDTRAPPTPAPPVACSESSSPLDASFSRGTEKLFRKCWSFRCVGTVHMTFLNYVARVDAVVYLLNSNGYQLTSLAGTHANYTASYPANGEMSIMYYDTNTWDHVNAIRIMAVWECEGGPVVRPAEDFDPSEYLTLPQEGTYQRLFSRMGPFNWVIPCTGTLNIVSQLGSVMHSTVRYNNSQNPVFSEGEPFTASRKYTVDDYFVVDLSGPWDIDMDNFFFLSWGCEHFLPTPMPDTRAPLTRVADTQVPDTRTPKATQTPMTRRPLTRTPTRAPDTQAPWTRVPDTRVPYTRTTATQTPMTRVPYTRTPWTPYTRTPMATRTPMTRVPDSTQTPQTAAPHIPGTLVPPTPVPHTALPTATPTDLPAGATFAPPTAVPHFTSPTTLPAGATALPPTATPTDLPAGATFAPPTAVPHFTSPTTLPVGATALPPTATPTDLPAGASFAPPTPAPDTALPTATPTDLPAGATFAPRPPAVNALCTADKDCRSGRLDPKATCNAGTCVCHTQGYAHPPGVPLCLLADDVTVPMGFAVEYGVGARSSWTTTATAAKERFEDTMGEALGTVTDMRVVVSYAGVLVVGMVRASKVKLADALSGKLNLAAALSSEGVSVSHGVTCTSTDASYTVQHNGVCNAVECEGSTTLTLADGTYTCEREAASSQSDESGGSSNVVLYVGIGVGVLVLGIAACVVAFCCQQQGQHPKELANPLFEMPLQESEVYPLGTEEAEETLN